MHTPSFLTPDQFGQLTSQGWEFLPETNGMQFIFCQSAIDGVSFDLFYIREQFYVFSYEWFAGGQGTEFEPTSQGYKTFDEVLNMTLKLTEGESGFDILEDMPMAKPRLLAA